MDAKTHKQIRVLYVEDTPLHLELTSRHLERKGFFVMTYRDGDEARKDIQGGLNYDIAVIDRSLKKSTREITGDDLIRLSKKYLPAVPVICTSAYADMPDYADRLLTKPFGLAEIVETINESLLTNKI